MFRKDNGLLDDDYDSDDNDDDKLIIINNRLKLKKNDYPCIIMVPRTNIFLLCLVLTYTRL